MATPFTCIGVSCGRLLGWTPSTRPSPSQTSPARNETHSSCSLGFMAICSPILTGVDPLMYARIVTSFMAVTLYFMVGDISLPNVPRQVSLAGGACGSQRLRAKALGLLFCQQALCLSDGMSNWCSSKLLTGQRLTARACSALFC